MKKILVSILLLNSLLCHSTSAFSQVSAQSLGACMSDSLNGRERKQLAQWIFFGMSAHPEINQYSNVSDSSRDEIDQTVGELITRLLAEDCPSQASQTLKQGGSLAMQRAFEVIGGVAMQELMTDQGVNASLAGFEKFLDQEKLNALVAQ